MHTHADLDAVFDASARTPVILLKHSQTCGISHMARGLLEDGEVPAPVHEIVLQYSRDLSNAVAAVTGVRHQSPQVIVIANRRATWHSSHAGVTPERLAHAWREAAAQLAGAADIRTGDSGFSL